MSDALRAHIHVHSQVLLICVYKGRPFATGHHIQFCIRLAHIALRNIHPVPKNATFS